MWGIYGGIVFAGLVALVFGRASRRTLQELAQSRTLRTVRAGGGVWVSFRFEHEPIKTRTA